MRMPIAGGPATVVLSGHYGYRCAKAPSSLCVLSELEGNRLIFWVLDPFEGRGRELTSVELKRNHFGQQLYAWSLSPDGKNIALVDNGASGDQVWILSAEGGASRGLRLKGWTVLQRVSWSADGNRLYVSGGVYVPVGRMGSAILETDLAGNFKSADRGTKGPGSSEALILRVQTSLDPIVERRTSVAQFLIGQI